MLGYYKDSEDGHLVEEGWPTPNWVYGVMETDY